MLECSSPCAGTKDETRTSWISRTSIVMDGNTASSNTASSNTCASHGLFHPSAKAFQLL